jgi:predicted aspartyl protease
MALLMLCVSVADVRPLLSRRLLLGAGLALPGLAMAQPASPVPPALLPEPLIPPAILDEGLEVEGDPLEAERRRARLFVEVRINGEGPFRFLVDSGADRSVVGAALAARLGLEPAGKAMLQSMAGRSEVETVRVDRLQIGPSVTRALRLPALPEMFMGADGLIGIDALAEERILLDHERRQVTVQRSRDAPPLSAGEGEIVVTARRRRGQLILTQVRANGVALYAVIDSGSEVTLGNSALRAKLFRRGIPQEVRTIRLVSVTGEPLLAELAVLPELQVGGLLLRGLPVAFADAGPFALFGLAEQPALLLGADVLRAFRRVALDFGGRRVRFTLPR